MFFFCPLTKREIDVLQARGKAELDDFKQVCFRSRKGGRKTHVADSETSFVLDPR